MIGKTVIKETICIKQNISKMPLHIILKQLAVRNIKTSHEEVTAPEKNNNNKVKLMDTRYNKIYAAVVYEITHLTPLE